MVQKEKEKKKGKYRWLLWTGFALLLLVAALGPLVLLITYTRDSGFRDYLNRDREVEQPPEQVITQVEPYMVHYIYRYCEHSKAYPPDGIPLELLAPPPVLTEVLLSLYNDNKIIESLGDSFKDINGWHVAGTRVSPEQVMYTITYLDDICPGCQNKFYLGIGENDFIAIFEGEPPGGKLHQLTEFKVKEGDRKELEEGVIIESLDDLDIVLQSYT